MESFFCNETEVAQLFQRRLTALAEEQGIPNDLRRDTIQGCLTSIHSANLASRLNSCYRYQLTRPQSAPDLVAETVANLLSDLGCRNVRVEHTVGLIPGGTFIHFEPTKEVEQWLHKTW